MFFMSIFCKFTRRLNFACAAFNEGLTELIMYSATQRDSLNTQTNAVFNSLTRKNILALNYQIPLIVATEGACVICLFRRMASR